MVFSDGVIRGGPVPVSKPETQQDFRGRTESVGSDSGRQCPDMVEWSAGENGIMVLCKSLLNRFSRRFLRRSNVSPLLVFVSLFITEVRLERSLNFPMSFSKVLSDEVIESWSGS